jgi:hypothetical protein
MPCTLTTSSQPFWDKIPRNLRVFATLFNENRAEFERHQLGKMKVKKYGIKFSSNDEIVFLVNMLLRYNNYGPIQRNYMHLLADRVNNNIGQKKTRSRKDQ